MTVIRWNPLREIDDLFARAGQFPPVGQKRTLNALHDRGGSFTPLADVSETPSSYFIELELPGVAADQVEVSVHEGVVTIAGERKAPQQNETPQQIEAQGQDHAGPEQDSPEQDSSERQVHRRERHYGSFERRFRLPKDARVDAIEATAREGVLSVSIGRRKEAARRAIEVQVA